jgi:hypothetical protein
MFSFKKQLVLTVLICWIACAGSLMSQTQAADLKSPDTVASDTAKSADTAKPADAAKPADTAKAADAA